MAEPITFYSAAMATAKVAGPYLLKQFQQQYEKKKSKAVTDERNALATDLGMLIRTEAVAGKNLQDQLLLDMVDAYDALLAKDAEPKDKRATAKIIATLRQEQEDYEHTERVQSLRNRRLSTSAPSRGDYYPVPLGRAKTQDSGMFSARMGHSSSGPRMAAKKMAPAKRPAAKKMAAKKAPAKKAAAKKAANW